MTRPRVLRDWSVEEDRPSPNIPLTSTAPQTAVSPIEQLPEGVVEPRIAASEPTRLVQIAGLLPVSGRTAAPDGRYQTTPNDSRGSSTGQVPVRARSKPYLPMSPTK